MDPLPLITSMFSFHGANTPLSPESEQPVRQRKDLNGLHQHLFSGPVSPEKNRKKKTKKKQRRQKQRKEEKPKGDKQACPLLARKPPTRAGLHGEGYVLFLLSSLPLLPRTKAICRETRVTDGVDKPCSCLLPWDAPFQSTLSFWVSCCTEPWRRRSRPEPQLQNLISVTH